jgi:hypothetical protein
LKYLITGTPRSRSAWLSALLTAHGSMCYHDALTNNVSMQVDAGIADPTIGSLQPEAIEYCRGPVVVIHRGREWVNAFERAMGVRLTRTYIEKIEHNILELCERADLVVPYQELENDRTVAQVVELCSTMPANMKIIRSFQQFTIQQHVEKARSSFSPGELALES